MNTKHDYLLKHVGNWLGSHGYGEALSENCASPTGRVDTVFKKSKSAPMVVEAKVADVYRSQVFPAMVGDAILRLGQEAENEDLMLAFLLLRMSKRAQADMQKYADRFRPDLNWYVIDEAGRGFARLHGVSEQIEVSPLVPEGQPRGGGVPKGSLFAAKNQWLLKVLMLNGLDSRYWGGPNDKPKSITELAQIAGVLQPSVSKFVSRFEEAGYLQRASQGLRVRRHRELLNDWYHAGKPASSKAVGVRPMYADESEDAFLERIKKRYGSEGAAEDIPRLAISHHLGCHLLGVGRSNVRGLLLHVRDSVDQVLGDLDLIRDDSDPPRMMLRWSRSVAPIFGGVVAPNGIPVCDILQCYLDVRSSRARGEEQAGYILDKVLMPHFKERS